MIKYIAEDIRAKNISRKIYAEVLRMGQHKTNPTAIAAKNGELPPKQKPMGKREWERMVTQKICWEIERRTGIYSVLRQVRRDDGGL